MSYSVLIKGGMALRGKKLERADIGINDGKIAEVGHISAGADLVVDAAGKYVSSGFIDITNHSDTHWTLFSQPGQESLLAQGITTILGGNCGASLAPLVKASDIEGIQKWADVSEINTNWHTVKEFFEELEKHPVGVNFATLVGHGTLRRGILGDTSRALSEKELEQIKFVLKTAMEEGAFGLSTSLASAHAKAYTKEEINSLLGIVAKYGGIAKHHLKDEGKNILPALAEVVSMGRDSKVKTIISHFKILGKNSWGSLPEALGFIEEGRRADEIFIDFFPYTRTGSLLYSLLPGWAIEGGKGKILEFLKDEKHRKEILGHLKSLTLHYDKIVVASTLKDPASIGKTIADLASSSGISPEEIIIKLLEINELHVAIFNEVISKDHFDALISKQYSMISSDGVGYNLKSNMPFDLPHPRSFGAFSRALQLFVKEEKKISWEEILYKYTELPAQTLGFKDRGRIEAGYFADIVVMDPEKIKSEPDYSALHHEVEGIDWVFVNGKAAVKNGVISGEVAGKIIKRG